MKSSKLSQAAVSPKITVYYDGLCHLCSREINHYRTLTGAENIEFLDITSPSFDAFREGVDPVKVHKTMHVRGLDGKMYLGVDAFVCIWQELPSLRFLVPIARFLPIHLLLQAIYFLFSKVRPLLPKKQCQESPFCETHRKI